MTVMRSRIGTELTVTDLFCGAGGSSIGAEASGARLRMAANHWELAIETHSSNFPDAAHDCADVSQVDPRRYPRTDILLASPECTHHSQARSKKHDPNLFNPDADPATERSRATMWDVPRFAEHHRYEVVVVENVVEVRKWAPWTAWLQAMDSLGYCHEVLYLNSMTAHPTPQSRDRLYVVFWRRGNRAPDLDFPVPALCPNCGQTEAFQAWKNPTKIGGKYQAQYVYRCSTCREIAWPLVYPAATAIDWSLPCPLIRDRTRPLAEATLRRIRVGLERFGPAAIVQKSGHTFERPGYARVWPIDGPLPTQTTEVHHALVVETAFGGDDRVRTTGEPLPTQTGRQTLALAFFLKNYGNAGEAKYRAFPVTSPLGAITAQDSHSIVAVPFIAELRGGSSDARSVEDPLATVTASGQHHGLVVPFYVKNYGKGDDPSMVKPVSEPLGAVTTQDHHSLLEVPFTVDYHGNGQPHPIDEPLGTQTTRDRHALVEPSIDVEDCGFRMLEPHEIGRAMAFPDDYTVLGTKRQKVRQYGNAVTPPVMTRIVERCIGSLA